MQHSKDQRNVTIVDYNGNAILAAKEALEAGTDVIMLFLVPILSSDQLKIFAYLTLKNSKFRYSWKIGHLVMRWRFWALNRVYQET